MESWIISMRRKEPILKNRKHLIRKRALVGWVTAVPLFVILLVVIILRHDQDGEGISREIGRAHV